MTTKDELHRLVETLSEPDATEVLDYIRWLLEEPDTLGPEEIERVRRGDEQIARGEYVTLDLAQRLVSVSDIGPRGDIYRRI